MARHRDPYTPRTFALYRSRRSRNVTQKFWPRVERVDGCWEWLGGRTRQGYGALVVAGRAYRAHRVSWEIHNGPIPPGMFVCHHCDNPPCVNPDHLFLGTPADNVHDMDAKGRRGRGWHPRLMGELHHASKLTDAQVVAIREAVAGGEAKRSVARRFSISHTYVGVLT